MNTMPTSVMPPSQNAMTAVVSSAKRLAASLPSACNMPANDGTNAALNAPSPNNRRNKLGSFNATKNASATGPAPNIAAINMSRANPKTRLAMVQTPTVTTPRSIEVMAWWVQSKAGALPQTPEGALPLHPAKGPSSLGTLRLVCGAEGHDVAVGRLRRSGPLPHKPHGWGSRGHGLLAGVQGAEPLAGVWGKAPIFLATSQYQGPLA